MGVSLILAIDEKRYGVIDGLINIKNVCDGLAIKMVVADEIGSYVEQEGKEYMAIPVESIEELVLENGGRILENEDDETTPV